MLSAHPHPDRGRPARHGPAGHHFGDRPAGHAYRARRHQDADFGQPVAVSGNTVVVGAPGRSAVYVFTESGSGLASLIETAWLASSDGNGFGLSVSISGNTVVVGAPYTGATYAVGQHGIVTPGTGSAYVFVKPQSGWTNMYQTAKLTASDGLGGDDFGCSVSISGNTVVVGASGATIGANSEQGAAYVFKEPFLGWSNMTQTAKLTSAEGKAYDEFGQSVSTSGNTVVVAPGDYRGMVYVFTQPSSGWTNMTQTAILTASDDASGFGYSTSISDNTVVVGACDPWVSGGDSHPQGAAYVFTEPKSGWANMTQTAKLTESDNAVNDSFGESVAISGNRVVVGAEWAQFGANDQAAYVFMEPGFGWSNMTQTSKLTESDDSMDDGFGRSVAISGATVVVGAPADHGQEAAYVFGTATAAPPTITSSPVKVATVGRKYTYQVQATASAGQEITFSLSAAPTGMSISTSNRAGDLDAKLFPNGIQRRDRAGGGPVWQHRTADIQH